MGNGHKPNVNSYDTAKNDMYACVCGFFLEKCRNDDVPYQPRHKHASEKREKNM